MRALCFRLIASYRQSDLAARSAGCCRYPLSCSHYAEDVLATRALPVALWLIAVRLLSCRRPMSRTTRRKVTSVLLLSGIVTLGTAGLAQAAAPAFVPTTLTRGGCTLALGGTDIGSFNRNNPLIVTEGKRITAEGLAPQKQRNAPEPPGSVTTMSMDFTVVSPLQTSYQGEAHNGFRTFSTSVNVDNYLHLGSGLYRVTIHAVGTSPVSPGWSCAATFYVKLDGSPVPGLVAGALGLAGLAGAATASGKSDWAVGDEIPPDSEDRTSRQVAAEGVEDATTLTVASDGKANAKKEAGALGCMLVLFAGVFGYMPENSEDVALAAGLGGLAAPGRRFWRRGHATRGFFSGLLMGLGMTVFMQQRGYWLLTWVNTIAFPLGLAVLAGWRAWMGKAFLVTSTAEPAPVAPEPPEPPVAPAAPATPVPPAVSEAPTPPLAPLTPMPPMSPMPSVTDALPMPPVEPAPPPADDDPAPTTH